MADAEEKLARQKRAREKARIELQRIDDEWEQWYGGPEAQIYIDYVQNEGHIDNPVELLTELRRRYNLTSDSASKQVFNTTELLERIVLELPVKDIFVYQRVSRRWKDCIQASHAIDARVGLRVLPPDQWYVDVDHEVVFHEKDTFKDRPEDWEREDKLEWIRSPGYHCHPIAVNRAGLIRFEHEELAVTVVPDRRDRRYNEAVAYLSLNLSKLNEHSSCLQASVTVERGFYGKYWVFDKFGTPVAAHTGDVPLTFGMLVDTIRQHSIDAEEKIMVVLNKATWSRPSFVNELKEHEVYRLPFLAKRGHDWVLKEVASYLDVPEHFRLREVCRSFRDTLSPYDHPDLKDEPDFGGYERWLLHSAPGHEELVARCPAWAIEVGESHVEPDLFGPCLMRVLDLSFGDSPWYTLHFQTILNEHFVERIPGNDIFSQAIQGYVELRLKPCMAKMAKKSSGAEAWLTMPMEVHMDVEILREDGRHEWVPLHDDLEKTWITASGIVETVKELRGTGKLRLRNVIGITKQEWCLAGKAPYISEEDVEEEEQRLVDAALRRFRGLSA